ncbi:MAG: hypothetical protein ACYDAE_02810 [Steroidobacteraceae bacterium]
MRVLSLLTAFALSVVVTSAWAQQGAPPAGGINSPTVPEGTTRDYVSPSDIKGLADLVDTKRMVEGRNLVSPALAKRQSSAMLAALHVSCRLADAKSIGAGETVVNGTSVKIALYEVSCGDGMGYLLTAQGAMASGISCFEAAGTSSVPASARSSDTDLKCQLPSNANIDAMATAVMRTAATSCAAQDVKWLGHSVAPDFDYTDVACLDGQEYVLRTPAPGSQGNIGVLTCQAASKLGASCQLTRRGAASGTAESQAAAQPTAGAQARPDLQWFENAFSRNDFACSVKNARIVGRESIKRRWVVEFQCAQHPRGVVAYVPSEGDTVNKFERIDCEAAATRHLRCKFPHTD